MKRVSSLMPVKLLGKKFMMLCMLLCMAVVSFAQDKKIDIDINADKDSGGFMGSPIMWVIGAAVFILLLVALLRGKSGSRRTDV